MCLDKTSKAYALYGEESSMSATDIATRSTTITEALSDNGMMLSGLSPDGSIVEMIELPDHPFFVATQAHPELKSRPNRPHPLFRGFIAAALKIRTARNNAAGYSAADTQSP